MTLRRWAWKTDAQRRSYPAPAWTLRSRRASPGTSPQAGPSSVADTPQSHLVSLGRSVRPGPQSRLPAAANAGTSPCPRPSPPPARAHRYLGSISNDRLQLVQHSADVLHVLSHVYQPYHGSRGYARLSESIFSSLTLI